MEDKKTNTLVGIFYGISTVLVLIGSFFKIQHFANGFLVLVIGLILGTATSSYDNRRLKKKIKSLEKQLKTIE